MVRKTLLIVDDEQELVENIIFDLEDDIPNIVAAYDGQMALNLIKNNENIGFVLTDIKMPKMDGLTFAKKAREHGFNLPIIFLTAHGDEHLMKEALKLNAFDFINKPYEKEDLLYILSDGLNESLEIQQKGGHSNPRENFKEIYDRFLKGDKKK